MSRKKQPDDSSEQLDFGLNINSQPDRVRQKPARRKESLPAQRISTRNAFTKALNEKGANGEGIKDATETVYNGMFDKDTRELYKSRGVQKGDRNALPREDRRSNNHR